MRPSLCHEIGRINRIAPIYWAFDPAW